ncbi:hypothetical protein ACQ4PT_033427 [Festuca glaucescens]
MAGKEAAAAENNLGGGAGRTLAIQSEDRPTKEASGSSTSAARTAAGDGVAEMLQRLKLTPQESKAFVLEDVNDDNLGCPEWVLVGKVLAPNTYHISTIRSALRPTWGNPKGLELRSMGANQFMAEFACERDKSRVLDGSPWNVGKHAVIITEFDPYLSPADYRFEELTLWARFLSLPFGLMNDQRGKSLAECVGKDVPNLQNEMMKAFFRTMVLACVFLMSPNAGARPNGKDNAGEVNSLVKPKKARARKANPKAQDDSGKDNAVAQGGGLKISGRKRKEYIPKVQPPLPLANPDANILVAGNELAITLPPVLGDDGVDSGTDSNKKHKTDSRRVSSGSADRAAAVLQPRHKQ